MTLQAFFNLLSDNPIIIISYFIFIPLTAIIAGVLGKGEGYLSPWKYLYATLVYLVAVPGIFAVTLSIYLFLFERISVFQTDIYTQILPVISMIATLFIIKKNVRLDNIPGFGKLSGLMMMILIVLLIMWGLDRTRIFFIAFTRMPFYFVGLIFVAMLFILRVGWSRFTK